MFSRRERRAGVAGVLSRTGPDIQMRREGEFILAKGLKG